MIEITYKIRQGQEDLTVVHYDSPLSVAQANCNNSNTGWVGALREEGSSRRVGSDQLLKPGSALHCNVKLVSAICSCSSFDIWL